MQALSALPVMQRKLIVLRDYHGNSYEDIAEILAGTVTSRLHRARIALRELLKHELKEVNHESV